MTDWRPDSRSFAAPARRRCWRAIWARANRPSPAPSSGRWRREADFDVPSPTFTLVQSYDETRIPVAHADLYRIGAAAEPANLDLTICCKAMCCWSNGRNGSAGVDWPDLLRIDISGHGGTRDAVLAGQRRVAAGAGARRRDRRAFSPGTRLAGSATRASSKATPRSGATRRSPGGASRDPDGHAGAARRPPVRTASPTARSRIWPKTSAPSRDQRGTARARLQRAGDPGLRPRAGPGDHRGPGPRRLWRA